MGSNFAVWEQFIVEYFIFMYYITTRYARALIYTEPQSATYATSILMYHHLKIRQLNKLSQIVESKSTSTKNSTLFYL